MYKVLYIDDLLEANYAYVLALKNNDKYHVIVAETPEEAMTSLESFQPPQCIILDIDMPIPEVIKEPLRSCWQRLGEPDNSYGLVIAAWVKKHDQAIKIIILSSVPNRYDEFREELGDVVVLDRLYDTPRDLLHRLNNLLPLKKNTDNIEQNTTST